MRIYSALLAGLTAVALPSPPPARPQPTPPTDWAATYAQGITETELRRHLVALTSDDLAGRETGEPGQRRAAAYLGAQLWAAGLRTQRQTFALTRDDWDTTHIQLQIGPQRFRWLRDFYASQDSPFAQLTALHLVFAGYGIEQGNYHDYAGLDVRGRDVVLLLGEPAGPDGRPRFGTGSQPSVWSLNSRAKARLAMQKGARSVLLVQPAADRFAAALARSRFYVGRSRLALPHTDAEPLASFLVSPVVGCALLGTTSAGLQRYQAAAAAAPGPVPSPFRVAAARLQAPRRHRTVRTANVLGYVPGTDKAAEVVVVSAHYDHLGTEGRTVYRGADDNGSGTAALLSIAAAFGQARQQGHGPRRSLLFLALTGEEKGLLGSEYYTRHPTVPLTQTVADLNIDMIGRTDDAHQPDVPYVDVVGAGRLSDELPALSEAVNQRYTRLQLDYRYDDPADPEQVYERSDHYNFARHGVPVIFYTTGDHADYHQPSDVVDKIEFGLLRQRTQLVFYTAWELASRDQRLQRKTQP